MSTIKLMFINTTLLSKSEYISFGTTCIRTPFHSVQIDCGAHPVFYPTSTGDAFAAGAWNRPHVFLVRDVELLELCLHASKTPSCANIQAQSKRCNADFFFLRRDSSVSMSLGYGLDYLGIGLRSLAKVRDLFLFSIAFRPTMGLIQSPIQLILGSLSMAIKWSSREADHLTPTTAAVEKRMEL
jgi:hypothetical protein